METDARDHKNYQLWYFEKAGECYKIKSKSSGNYLSSACKTTTDSVWLSVDAQDEQENNQLWYFEKTREFYKIKNKSNGNYLSSVFETTNSCVFLAAEALDEKEAGRLWYFEKTEELSKSKNNTSRACSDSCEPEANNRRKNTQEEQTKNTMWYAGGCGPCGMPANTYATDQRVNDVETEIDKYTLLSTSFLSGAAYSLVPEIVTDVLTSRGYPRASTVVGRLRPCCCGQESGTAFRRFLEKKNATPE